MDNLQSTERPTISDFVRENERPLILGGWSSKGGVGKTTISTNLADALAARGLKVAMIDRDTQGSLKVIKRRAAELELKLPYEIFDSPPENLIEMGFDVVVFDHAPRLGEEFIPYEFTDLVLAATRPSYLDVESLKDCLLVLKNKQIPTLGVLNCFKERISDHKATQLSHPTFAVIQERNAYPVSMRAGSGVFSAKFPKEDGRTKFPSGLKDAQSEMQDLVVRIENELNLTLSKTSAAAAVESGDNQ